MAMRKNARALREMCRRWRYDGSNYCDFFNILQLLFIIKPESKKELHEQFGLEPSKAASWHFDQHLPIEKTQRIIVALAETAAEKLLKTLRETSDITATIKTLAQKPTLSIIVSDIRKVRKF
ncbi:MAG: hypothetical protein A2754_01715 [Candidatus Magasanikbacteria bacterium RIFCSPHIGHO2_01_FULL_47_8]|uniref:Uncharacterized protein n=1 Tax=Candidatus Magasanikbacteria bacterium RIFCSPHIGHO2_01_FULL_47_8 TaxID=1798673 RepID=A0A1F6MDL6_9BACT|nr:MAG: hypothetical protein A2754_01715 [Candidatus Magasanikbacteria bacterium RIFCSPHIGHO2_01_FULL_47_8]